jgi:hypothetical protein
MTNKTEVTTQKTKTMKEESRDSDNIRDKTQNEDKQNRSYNTLCVGHHYMQTNTNKVNEIRHESFY